jgi:shikimate dehydrogenase
VIYWANRTPARQVLPWNWCGPQLERVSWSESALLDLVKKVDVVINATTLGWQAQDRLAALEQGLTPQHTFFDLNYRRESALLMAAREAHSRVLDGGEMLVQQAAAAFSLLTGRESPLNRMRNTLLTLETTPPSERKEG